MEPVEPIGLPEPAEAPTTEDLHWYEITFAGKSFTISSRSGATQIQRIERLLADTVAEMGASAQGQSLLSVALLVALTLADRVISAEANQEHLARQIDSRLDKMIEELDRVLVTQSEPAGKQPRTLAHN